MNARQHSPLGYDLSPTVTTSSLFFVLFFFLDAELLATLSLHNLE